MDNIIVLTLLAVISYLLASWSVEEYTNCTYDIEHNNYVTYSGDFEVEVQYQPKLGKGYRRVA